jgi:hypothetical protein
MAMAKTTSSIDYFAGTSVATAEYRLLEIMKKRTFYFMEK